MTMIYPGVYQFSLLIPHMLFTIHQYLLLSEEPVLISTGTAGQAERILPGIKKFLNGKELAYVLLAHMESDECGGLSIFQREYPKMITVCSELCARELRGFGYAGVIAARGRGDVLSGKGFSLKFIDCPSEVHLQDGLVFYEETRRIFLRRFNAAFRGRRQKNDSKLLEGRGKFYRRRTRSQRREASGVTKQSARAVARFYRGRTRFLHRLQAGTRIKQVNQSQKEAPGRNGKMLADLGRGRPGIRSGLVSRYIRPLQRPAVNAVLLSGQIPSRATS